MQHLFRMARLLVLVVLLIPVSLTAARPALEEPTPPTGGAEMQLLTAPAMEQAGGASGETSADVGAASGAYRAVFGAYVRQGSPATNYATDSQIFVGYDGGVMRGLLLFDLSALPPGVTVNSAWVELYVTESYDYPNTSRTVTAYRAAAWWTEFLVNWNNAPAWAEAHGSTPVPHAVDLTCSIDLTNLVRGWLDGAYPNYGVVLRGPESEVYRAFASDGTTQAPRLVVDYTLPGQAMEVSPASLSFAIGQAANFPGHALRRNEYTLKIDASTVDVLDWSATKVGGASWLSLEQSSGKFSWAEPALVRASVMTETLTPGQVYSAQIQVSSTPAVSGSPQTVGVTLWYTDGLYVNFAPAVLKNRAFSAQDYQTVALFIGISDYIYLPVTTTLSDPREPPKPGDLKNAHADPHYLRDASIDEVTAATAACCGGGFRPGNTLLLTEWRATKTAIREAFHWLDCWENEDTLVLITFSGHGGYTTDAPPFDEADGRDEFIVAAESDGTSDMAGVILDDELAAWLDELESNNVVLIFDSCFAGGMISAQSLAAGQRLRSVMPPAEAALMAGDGLAQDVSGPGRLVITAASETQGSWEFDALEGGALSYYLIQALLTASADTNGDGWISFEEAFAYAAPRVDSYVFSRTGLHQNPQMSDGIAGEVKWARP